MSKPPDQTGIRARTLDAMFRLDGHAWRHADGDWHERDMPNWVLLANADDLAGAHAEMRNILGPYMSRATFTLSYFIREEEGMVCLVYLDGNAAIEGFDPSGPISPYRIDDIGLFPK